MPKRPRFKPVGGARRGDYEVRKIGHREAAALIRDEHYAQGSANTSTEAFGLFRGARLVGAALWMPPTRRCAETVDRERWRRVVSLSRLALAPTEPTNSESLFIGAMLRVIDGEGRWVAAVTFADGSQGHEGTIYRATNWEYVGQTAPEPRWEDANGKQVSRLSTKSRTPLEMAGLGYRMVGKFAKHKFIFRFRASRTSEGASVPRPQLEMATLHKGDARRPDNEGKGNGQ